MEGLKYIIRDLMRSIDVDKDGLWPGHDSLQELLYDQYHIKAPHADVIHALRELQYKGWVFTEPIKDEKGKFQGIGWYFNHQKDK